MKKKAPVKMTYDLEVDILYIRLDGAKIVGSEEGEEGVVPDYDVSVKQEKLLQIFAATSAGAWLSLCSEPLNTATRATRDNDEFSEEEAPHGTCSL